MAKKPSLIRRLFRGIWRTIVTLYAVLLIVMLLVVPVGLYFAFFSGPSMVVEKDTALVWAPTGDLVEQHSRGVGNLVGSLVTEPQRQSVVRDLIEALDRAADDDRIKLAFLKLDELGGAQPGQVQDLVAAIDRFKQSGKPVVAWSPSYGQSQYALASHADTVYMDPFGYVFIPGYGVFRNYYKDAIDKLGVEINVFRVGEYKSYVEPFTRNDMSPQARAANQTWMNSLWQIYREQVSAPRDYQAQHISDYIDGFPQALSRAGGDAARVAADAGLVDEVASLADVRDAMREQVGSDESHGSFRQIHHVEYLNATDAEQPAPRTESRIATVVVEGAIVDGESVPGQAGGDTIARMIANARRDDHVAAVLLRVNSPGGSVTASERIREQVAATREAGKPVVVSMAGVAASGGYWIAMNADEIWAEPSTITGSIGIFGIVPTFSKPLEDLGIHTDGVGTTALSGAMRLDKPLSEPVKMMLQAGVEHGYDQFVGRVAEARDMQEDAVRRIAEGRVWSGADAERIGLVDKLGGYVEAEKATAKLAGLGEGDYAIELMQPPADWRTAIREFLSSHVESALVPDWFAQVGDASALDWLRNGMNDPRHLYAHCFCALDTGAPAGRSVVAPQQSVE
ncbi:signal peptide peptidase SppA, 67K type [Salinisphaera dokdonensis CL-ES53]|uniref:Signal peptide peptidase SppA, 67K type n=1 Tax=Salinisphaera dokdonensis CL-ES53 TaxID=1304272 RepID=A0ABV2AX58_9GAMM